MKHLLLITGIMLLGAGAAQAEPQRFGNAVKMGTVPDIKLSRAQRVTLRAYRAEKAYFGAYYIVPETDYGFWTLNFHDFDMAKAATKKGCEIISEGGNCQLYAVVYPDGIDPNARGAKGMGQRAAKDFEQQYPKAQKPGTFGAFALNGADGYGISYGWNSAAEAREAARAYCNIESARALAPLGIEGRAWAIRQGLDTCEVVHTHSPE